MAPAGVHPVFPDVPLRRGMYESFYLRAVAPDEPLGVWIRYTVEKRPRERPRGSLWCTCFDATPRAGREGPFMHKLTTDDLAVPDGGWIAVGESRLGPTRAEGACGEARWALGFACAEPELRHLPRALLYRTPLPRTKLTSPLPAASFDGVLEVPAAGLDGVQEMPAPAPGGAGQPPQAPDPPPAASPPPAAGPPSRAPGVPGRRIELRGWRGMVGHNWGAEHAERWIWLHGIGFQDEPDAWLDVAIARVRLAGRTTPWVATGALHIDGERHRLGGLGTRGLRVAETPQRAVLSLPGAHGLVVEAHVQSAPSAIARWRYADPDGAGREVSNCSIAALTLAVRRPGLPVRTLSTAHGAAYELGVRERDRGVAADLRSDAPPPEG